jgi:Uma2 family endonuclease
MKVTPAIEVAEPTWDIAHLFPRQGTWSEEEYLSLETNHLVEFSHGYIEVLPMPTEAHQLIVAYLYGQLLAFVRRYLPGAVVLFAPLPVQLWAGKYREPDVILMLAEHADRRHQRYWEVPDLVMEVVSPDYRRHDLETKRREYAQAGIPEYWIVDPEEEQITVLRLEEGRYVVHGVFGRGMVARSALLEEFEVAVDEAWAATSGGCPSS